MIKSMTGFASVTRETESATISVTIRSVNHRYLDVQLRVPQSLGAIEASLRAMAGQSVARGRLEIGISLQVRTAPVVEVEFNEAFGRALDAALQKARDTGLVTGSIAPGDLLRFPQALMIRERNSQDEAVMQDTAERATAAVGDALADLDQMRMHEGGHLRTDLAERCATVAGLVERIASAADEGRVALEQRLHERVRQLRTAIEVDEVAVAQEVVRVALRSDIAEEVARFRAHVAHWASLAEGPEPCGRKLDFLLQEMNREVNTMGSKADGIGVSELVIAAKAELERMREQVQNVE